MSIKKYGIYLCYPPHVDLRKEGLGRYLANFIKGTINIPEVHIVIACPCWLVNPLKSLLKDMHIMEDKVSIITTNKQPYLVYIFNCIEKLKKINYKRQASILISFIKSQERAKIFLEEKLICSIVNINNIVTFLGFLLSFIIYIPIILFLIPTLVLFIFEKVKRLLISIKKATFNQLKILSQNFVPANKLVTCLGDLKKYNICIRSSVLSRLSCKMLEKMLEKESQKVNFIVDNNTDVVGWYCPTIFWPNFNKIKALKLLCVPDVHLLNFPITFAIDGSNTARFSNLLKSIRTGDNFVTYSANIKWNVLVNRYGIAPSKISIVRHAPSTLDHFIKMEGCHDSKEASIDYCKNLLINALNKNNEKQYSSNFKNREVKFIFYASQFRANKNIKTLLHAYNYLLKKCHFQHKLILTGHPSYQDIRNFVLDNKLEYDVLFLHNLTITELAACYKLADIAVCPSLSEGGGPFTFTEALSVNTPALIGRIPVAEELITDEKIRAITFFDPYSYKDLAEKVQITLQNKAQVLTKQLEYFSILNKRTWSDVGSEHIAILDNLSLGRNNEH